METNEIDFCPIELRVHCETASKKTLQIYSPPLLKMYGYAFSPIVMMVLFCKKNHKYGVKNFMLLLF